MGPGWKQHPDGYWTFDLSTVDKIELKPRPAPLRVRTDDLPPPVEVVRELPGPGVLVAAVRCILLTALVGLLAFACGALTGCDNGGASPSGTSLGERVYAVTEAAWYARGDLPAISDRGNCERLYMLQVWAPATLAEYARVCPANSAACLYWTALRGAGSRYYPVAVMAPRLSASRWPAHAIHELLHALRKCAGLPRDDGHDDARTWEGTAKDPHPASVESVSERAIYEPAE